MPLTSASAIAYFAFIAALPRTSTCTVHVLAGRRKPSLTYLKRGHCGFQNGPVTNGKGPVPKRPPTEAALLVPIVLRLVLLLLECRLLAGFRLWRRRLVAVLLLLAWFFRVFHGPGLLSEV